MSNCLQNIIGITDKTDIPYYADLDADLQTKIAISSSGLFTDRLTGGIDLMAVDDTDYMTSVLKLALDARTQAEKILSDELLLAINNRYHAAKRIFNGYIGRRTVSATSSSAGNLQGQRYRMHEPIAGFITINSIGVNVNGNADFHIYVARCNAKNLAIEENLHAFPITSVGGTFTNCDMSSVDGQLKLPMEIEGIPQEYYIYWDRTEAGGLFAKNNEIRCGTCGSNREMLALSSFMEFHGVSFSSTDNVRNANIDKMGHGLSVAAVVGCDHSTVICREYDKKEAVKLMMQWAALYKTGELWIEYILKSGFVNRDNMQSREYLWGKRNNFKKEFDERVTSIVNTMELGETNCYVCSENTMQKGTIYS